mmetsp:Transcript_29085/g.83584  ORF Transcript_29085/g.83584 Transcript_29085/m.83584 type:complete len:278 (-) Transcript_29085:43-876(-)
MGAVDAIGQLVSHGYVPVTRWEGQLVCPRWAMVVRLNRIARAIGQLFCPWRILVARGWGTSRAICKQVSPGRTLVSGGGTPRSLADALRALDFPGSICAMCRCRGACRRARRRSEWSGACRRNSRARAGAAGTARHAPGSRLCRCTTTWFTNGTPACRMSVSGQPSVSQQAPHTMQSARDQAAAHVRRGEPGAVLRALEKTDVAVMCNVGVWLRQLGPPDSPGWCGHWPRLRCWHRLKCFKDLIHIHLKVLNKAGLRGAGCHDAMGHRPPRQGRCCF